MGSRHVRCKWNHHRYISFVQVPGPEKCMHPPSYKTSGCRADSLPQNYPARLPCVVRSQKKNNRFSSFQTLYGSSKKRKTFFKTDLKLISWNLKKWRMDDLRWVSFVEAWCSGLSTPSVTWGMYSWRQGSCTTRNAGWNLIVNDRS